MGEVLDELDRLEMTENTLVIFSSDNGPARSSRPAELGLMHDTATGAGYNVAAAKGITSGRKGYKSSLFEGGIGVPFIARWPGKIPSGRVDKKSILSAVDLLPTFCDVAGVELPNDYQPDGISQINALMGNGMTMREKPLFWKFNSPWPPQASRPHHWISYAVVENQWKLVTNSDQSHVELYDLLSDPFEKKDLSQSSRSTVNHLTTALNQWVSTLPAKPTGNVFSSERFK